MFEYLDWNYGAEEEDTEDGETEAPEEETAEAAGDAGEADAAEEDAGETDEPAESDGEEEETVEYDLGYFFAGDENDGDYVLTVPEEQLKRQLGAQYPSEEVIRRASIMEYFNEEQSELINRMWIRVRCFNINSVPVAVWIVLAAVIAAGVIFHFRRKAAKEKLYS